MMKKIQLILALFLLCMVGNAAATYGKYKQYTLFDFENSSIIDKYGNSSITLMNGAVLATDDTHGGVVSMKASEGGYFHFDKVPLVSDTCTIAFWIKRDASDPADPWKQIFEFHNANDDSNIYLTPLEGWTKNSSTLVSQSASFGTYENIGGSIIKSGEWTHVTISINGSNWSYYLNGVLQSKALFFGTLGACNPTDLYFGTNPKRGNYPVTALFDDVTIFHQALSPSQVVNLYKGEEITDPVDNSLPNVLLHLDGNLTDESQNVNPSGSGVSFISDAERGSVVQLDSYNSYIAFDKQPIPVGSSTINFLFKKERFDDTDNGKYIYQCSNATGDFYGLRLNVVDGTCKVQLVNKVNGTESVKDASVALSANKWNALTIYHLISGSALKGTMRIYQNGVQVCALTNISTFSLNLNNWRIGGVEAGTSIKGRFDEFEVHNRTLSQTEITSYYTSLTSYIALTVNATSTKQTIRNFGASDAWNAELIGKSWPLQKKEKLAELLFSKEFDADGTPKGIGLSSWRFNIGSGSAEQGEASRISSPAKRTEGFLNDDGSYNWERQAGQRWFLNKAVKDYKVETVIGWVNSPPVQYTRDNLAFNANGQWSSILKSDKYPDFARFIADVVTHFKENEGIDMAYISPLNEPQFQWTGDASGIASQEGSPWTDAEITKAMKALNDEFVKRNISAELFAPEAAQIKYMLKKDNNANMLGKFYGTDNAQLRFGDLPKVSNIVAAHSYWNDYDAWHIVAERADLYNEMQALDPNLEYWQTEYSLLGSGYTWGHQYSGLMSEIQSGISLARIIHNDLVVAGATGWQWWTTFELGKHGGESRFALIEAVTNKEKTDGVYNPSKLLYTLGNYSRFIRPGMKRVELNRSDAMSDWDVVNKQMFSAFINEETNEVVLVAINATNSDCGVRLSVENLENASKMEFTPYVTADDAALNLKAYSKVKAGDQFMLPALSVVSFVGKINNVGGAEDPQTTTKVKLYPNPATDILNIDAENALQSVIISDMSGRVVLQQNCAGLNHLQLPVSQLEKGVYLVSLKWENNSVKTEKLIKK